MTWNLTENTTLYQVLYDFDKVFYLLQYETVTLCLDLQLGAMLLSWLMRILSGFKSAWMILNLCMCLTLEFKPRSDET